MSENEVERQIIQWMQDRKWRRQRNHVGIFTTAGGERVSIGTAGTPDWTFKRGIRRGCVEICHVETKAPGKKPGKAQLEQMALLNHLGEPAWWADSLDAHVARYREAGWTKET